MPGWVVGLIIVVVVIVAGSAGSLGTSSPGGTANCFTKCGFFMEFRCEDGKLIGPCFMFWPCNAGIGAHPCVRSGQFPWNLFAGNCPAPSLGEATL